MAADWAGARSTRGFVFCVGSIQVPSIPGRRGNAVQRRNVGWALVWGLRRLPGAALGPWLPPVPGCLRGRSRQDAGTMKMDTPPRAAGQCASGVRFH
jgi:hypothetical protein